MLLHFLLVAMCWFGIKDCDVQPKHDVVVVADHNITKHVLQNTNLKLLEKTKTVTGYRYHFSMGTRVYGDILLASGSLAQTFKYKKDNKFSLDWPHGGPDDDKYVASYVEVFVEQSATWCNAFVEAGGIGQPHITVAVESKRIIYIRADADFYGY